MTKLVSDKDRAMLRGGSRAKAKELLMSALGGKQTLAVVATLFREAQVAVQRHLIAGSKMPTAAKNSCNHSQFGTLCA